MNEPTIVYTNESIFSGGCLIPSSDIDDVVRRIGGKDERKKWGHFATTAGVIGFGHDTRETREKKDGKKENEKDNGDTTWSSAKSH